MDDALNWFAAADTSKYEHKYVSIVDNHVVRADDDPEVAYLEAKKKCPDKEVVLWKVLPAEHVVFLVSKA